LRIVHVAIFNTHKYGTDFYATDRKISHGLIRNGHFVYDFSYRDICRSESIFKTTRLGTGRVNQKLLQVCKTIRPDLLLLGHSELIQLETLKKIKEILPGLKIALWFVDSLFLSKTHKTAHLFDRLEGIDVFFATTGGEYLKAFKTKKNIVSFIPNMVDGAVEVNRNFIPDAFDIDFLYCGRDDAESGRKSFLAPLFDAIDKKMRCEIRGAFGNPLVFGNDYIKLLSRTKMGLNFSRRNDIYLYSSDRIVQLTGNGILTFCPKVPGMETLFNDSEIIYFNEVPELVDKIAFYHGHDAERKRIAENGWHKTHMSYNASRVTRFMLELIWEENFSQDYEWKNEIYKNGQINLS
jgi:hypothetical protein